MKELAPSEAAAREAGLRHSSDALPGIVRLRHGRGFRYRAPSGAAVRDRETLARIAALAIPPAYTEVWICPDPLGHLQATGCDARGRKQYRYHPRWRAHRDATKYHRMASFAAALPGIRAHVDAALRRQSLTREKVLAVIVRLLDTTLIRIGNEDYARENGSFGLTTLRNRHVAVEGGALRFRFPGKSGRVWKLRVEDRRVTRVVRELQDLPGQELFSWQDEAGEVHGISSGEVNDYLREISGEEITAKDFRTWAGTVLCGLHLAEQGSFGSATEAKRRIRDAVAKVAARLGNTPSVCRQCYIHPEVLERFARDEWRLDLDATPTNGLRPDEGAVLAALTDDPSSPPKVRRPPPQHPGSPRSPG
ncbi:DNA topoisomerase IB [Sabulicella rubraurantiaca]|uniref:DNA topoisomerase IB n=1 Tax=Sabulicella rubraurantiaca TaxID=2811429 RepID=UPI001A96D549|nr:DNA topoisomerase IB [Sabulicella rubraurantiaca]